MLTMHSPSHAKTVAGTASRRSRGRLKESIATKGGLRVSVGEERRKGGKERDWVKEAGVHSNLI